MSGFDDPCRHPREQHAPAHFRRDEPFDPRSHRNDGYDQRSGPRRYHDEPYGRDGPRDWRRGGGGRDGSDGRRHPERWDDDGGRDYKRGRYEDSAPPRYDRDHGSHGRLHDPYHQPYEPHPGHQYTPQMHDPAYVNAVPYGSDPNEGRHSRGNSAGPTPRSKAPELEPPSASVILLGLPAHVTDVLLRNFLEDMGASIDSTTVIMDRQTGLSKRFGFAKFSSVEHARSFIEPNFPSIPWRERNGPGPDDGMRIKVNYSQKTGGWRDDQGASARLSEDQRATAGAATQGFYINDGTRDIGTTPSQMLLLRGIDPLTSEDEIASALTRVGGRAGQEVARGGLKRVLLVKDRASRSSWGFAFVQFADVRLATEVLSAAFNPQFHPTGFRIRNSIVAASFSHENSFVPLYSPSPWSFKGDGGAQLAYWDDKGFAQPWTPPAMPDPAAALRGVPKAPRAQEEAKAEADLAAFFDSIEEEMPAIADAEAPQSAPTAQAISSEMAQSAPATVQAAATSALPSNKAAPAPISIKPITALPASIASSAASGSSTPHAESSGSSAKASAKASAHISTTVKGVSTPAPAPPVAAIPLEAKEKKGNLIVSRKAAPNLAKWNKKAKELRSAKPAPAAPAAAAATAEPVKATPVASTSQTKPQQQPTTSAAQPTAVPTSSVSVAAFDDPEFVHGDPISFQCLLCQRQFKAVDELRKHNKLSQLHKTNVDNAEALAACATRKATAAKKYAAAALADASSSKPKYVDRAAARRVALGRSDEPQPGQNNKKRKLEGPEPPKPTPAAPNKDGLEESNAGRKMLEKMGWSAGGGLGAEGAGRIDPVQAAQFAQGAGLGSTKGVAVGSEEAPTTYADRMREKALKRFNSSLWPLAICSRVRPDSADVPIPLAFSGQLGAKWTNPAGTASCICTPLGVLGAVPLALYELYVTRDDDNDPVVAVRCPSLVHFDAQAMRRPNLRRVSTTYQSPAASPGPQESSAPAQAGLRSIAFGVCPAEDTFSTEWRRAARGIDYVKFEKPDKRKQDETLIVRMFDANDTLSTDPTCASSIQLRIAVDTIERCRSLSGGIYVLLSLSRPPLLEVVSAALDGKRPRNRQVDAFDPQHASVIGYAGRELLLELRTRADLGIFIKQSTSVKMPRLIAEKIALGAEPRHDETSLAVLQSWLSTLDFRIAFQIEKLVRNGLVDAVKVMQLRGDVDRLATDRGARETEQVLAFFADSLANLDKAEPAYQDESVAGSPAATAGQKRQLGSITLNDSDSSDSSSSESEEDKHDGDEPSDDDDVLVVGASLPFLRGLKSSRAAQTSAEELRTLLSRAIDGSYTFNRLGATAEETQLVRSVAVTPTRLLLSGPTLGESNTVVRSHGRPDCFLTVSFRQEDGQRLREADNDIIAHRFRPLMQAGFDLGGRSWSFLAWSSSGLKAGNCFFMTPFRDPDQQVVTPSAIHRDIGDFTGTETSLIPAKYFARISQGFTASKPTVRMKASQITTVPDLASESGSLFSDGVGLIAPKLAKRVVEALGYDVSKPQTVPPTCFQIRLGGAKGMVQVDPALHGRTIALRPSQVKFRSSLANLEVAGVFGAGPAFLNRPLIKLLEDLGVRPAQFMKLQTESTAKIAASRATMASATTLLREWNLAPETGFVASLNFFASHATTRGAAHANPFVGGCLNVAIVHALREIKYSGRIPLPGCYNLVGVVDVDECLGPDFFFEYVTQDRTGLVATRQLHLADAHPEGLFHPACLKLAQLHSDSIDAQKSGTFVPAKEIPKPPLKGWPDFLTDSAQDSHRSSKALGQLYRAVSLDKTDCASPFDPPYAVDPLRTLTTALSRLDLPQLSTEDLRLPPPQATLVSSYRAYLPSFSAELLRLDCSTRPGQGTSEEALFLSVTLGSRRLQQSDRAEIGRLRERASMLFAIVRKVIAEGQAATGRAWPLSTEEKALNAWAAWHAAVNEGKDRAKARIGSANGKAARREEQILGLRIWGWLALGVLVEQLERLKKEKVEVLTID